MWILSHHLPSISNCSTVLHSVQDITLSDFLPRDNPFLPSWSFKLVIRTFPTNRALVVQQSTSRNSYSTGDDDIIPGQKKTMELLWSIKARLSAVPGHNFIILLTLSKSPTNVHPQMIASCKPPERPFESPYNFSCDSGKHFLKFLMHEWFVTTFDFIVDHVATKKLSISNGFKWNRPSRGPFEDN